MAWFILAIIGAIFLYYDYKSTNNFWKRYDAREMVRKREQEWDADLDARASAIAERVMEDAAKRGFPRTEAAFKAAKIMAVDGMKSNPWTAQRLRLA